MNRWLDFPQIKQSIPLAVVLEHYGWKWCRRRGDRVQGRCPIPRGEREDAFPADLRYNGFPCFSCQAHGSVLDLVAALERCSLRQAALWIQEWFVPQPWTSASAPDLYSQPKSELIRKKGTGRPLPLRFSLWPVDSGHAYLRQRGVDVDAAARLGIGYYAGPGLMHGRVVIPIHDEYGQLLAYAGRAIGNLCPKYKLPAGFRKSDVLFNLHRAKACGSGRIILVEGFFDCLQVLQAGLPNVVALMGCCLSFRQEMLLLDRFRHVVLMLDADPAGQQGSRVIATRLATRCKIEIIHLESGQQPDQLSSAEIHRALSTATADRPKDRRMSEYPGCEI